MILAKRLNIGWWFLPFCDGWLFVLSTRRDAWRYFEQKLLAMGFWSHQIALARINFQYPRVAETRRLMATDYSKFERQILVSYYSESRRVEDYILTGRYRRLPSDNAFTIATSHLRQAKERL